MELARSERDLEAALAAETDAWEAARSPKRAPGDVRLAEKVATSVRSTQEAVVRSDAERGQSAAAPENEGSDGAPSGVRRGSLMGNTLRRLSVALFGARGAEERAPRSAWASSGPPPEADGPGAARKKSIARRASLLLQNLTHRVLQIGRTEHAAPQGQEARQHLQLQVKGAGWEAREEEVVDHDMA